MANNNAKHFYEDDENALSIYLKEINEIDLLSREDELDVARLAVEGDKNARNKLVRSHLRFVVSVAKKFQNQGMTLADLISEGNLGLLHAIDRFDPEQGFHFISYAVWWIRQSIMKALGEKARSIRLPQNRANELVQIEKVRKVLEAGGKNATATDISHVLGLKYEIVQDLMNVARGMISLDAPARSDAESNSTVGEFIADSQYEKPHQTVEGNELRQEINRLLTTLSAKEAEVLELRFGLNGKQSLSLKDIGEQFKLTKERIRQIEKKALHRLRHPSRIGRLQSFVA